MVYLAHVWRAEAGAAMRALVEIMERQNPQPSFLINKARVSVDLREAIPQPEMLQNRLNEKYVCVTNNPQITPKQKQQTIKNKLRPQKKIYIYINIYKYF